MSFTVKLIIILYSGSIISTMARSARASGAERGTSGLIQLAWRLPVFQKDGVRWTRNGPTHVKHLALVCQSAA